MTGLNRLILLIAGALMVYQSTAIYAVNLPEATVLNDIELSEESSDDQLKLSAYEAVVPVVQDVQSSVRYLLGEVVVITKPTFQQYFGDTENIPGNLHLLFPKIISPNAP